MIWNLLIFSYVLHGGQCLRSTIAHLFSETCWKDTSSCDYEHTRPAYRYVNWAWMHMYIYFMTYLYRPTQVPSVKAVEC
jgi:hypothetical protein